MARAKLMGMRRGETDLRFYFFGPRLLQVEMKTMDGVVSGAQEKRHALMAKLGFDIRVMRAACPADAVRQVEAILGEYLTVLA